jgi:broad specificity phosphatase PhoE
VRHAAAGIRKPGPGDEARPLSAKGLAQAAGLIPQLEEVGIARVLSSPFIRCRQTVEPLAAARGLPVEDLEALAEDHPPEEVMRLLPELAPSGAALCSHGDVIAGVVDSLVAAGLVTPARARCPKGSTWLLELEGGRVVSARYLPPPETG